MATEPAGELELFHRFLGDQLQNGQSDLSPEESVKAFRAYQRDLQRLQDSVRPALERSLRRESQPLDIDDLKARVTKRLDDRGITD
jgi:hypothetical protein